MYKNLVKNHQQQESEIFSTQSTTEVIKQRSTMETQTNSSEEVVRAEQMKLILSIDQSGPWLSEMLNFEDCQYSNCVFRHSLNNISYAQQADVLIFGPNYEQITLQVPAEVRQRQLWFVFSLESPAFSHNRFNKVINSFNGSMTYSPHSIPAHFPYGLMKQKADNTSEGGVDYAKNKTKGAYAYVSNCYSHQYNRLETMRHLLTYVNGDIFGSCTNQQPCPRKGDDFTCEAKVHPQYRFYLAFENSLCKDYITEKFWKTLENRGYFIPVALGGLSIEEYTDVAPPDSFIHVYNFSSIEALGKYLQHLMNDDAAYNRYHEWRHSYTVTRETNKKSVCSLCESINHPESLRAAQSHLFADEWNNQSNCKNLANRSV
ncbi:glycoprotein 3-alpha-L-fucosyltransferase A-like [Watersipora subatra]|uniref:glycoprotein 3-alpha-L-fucosyltransferase A-like n=1 Tax=Watersipora subatra TaxID=2589382 RepID=UPI00355AD550